MKTILEISRVKRVVYTMDDEVYSIVERALRLRLVKTVGQVIAMLPEELTKSVSSKELPMNLTGLLGVHADTAFMDNMGSQRVTPEYRDFFRRTDRVFYWSERQQKWI